MLREFPEIQAISVFGGEKANPPQYGKVFVALDIASADIIPESNKNNYIRYLSDKVPLATAVEFVEPSFVYLSINGDIKYNFTVTDLSENQLKTIVASSIVAYSNEYLNDFNVSFRYSNFLASIDASHFSILNNDTSINPYIKIVPTLGVDSSFSLSFDTDILVTTPTTSSHSISDDRGVFSSPFTFNTLNCKLEDDGVGNMRIVRVTSTSHISLLNVGTVNYSTGLITLNNINIEQFNGDAIKIYIKPVNNDFAVLKQNILKIDVEDIVISMTPVNR